MQSQSRISMEQSVSTASLIDSKLKVKLWLLQCSYWATLFLYSDLSGKVYHSKWCAYVLLWVVMVLGGECMWKTVLLSKEIMETN